MAAPNLQEVEWAIRQLEAEESSASNYALLAALYACRREMLPQPSQPEPQAQRAQPAILDLEPPPEPDSDFLRAASQIHPADAWDIMDDLMDTLQAASPRVYQSVMRKLRER